MIGLPTETKQNSNPGPGQYETQPKTNSHNVRIGRETKPDLFDKEIKQA